MVIYHLFHKGRSSKVHVLLERPWKPVLPYMHAQQISHGWSQIQVWVDVVGLFLAVTIQILSKPPFCNEEAFLLMWQNLTSIKMRLVHQKISYTFTPYIISVRMAFLHLESKQLSSEDATSKDFFCQVTFKLIWAVIWINFKHSSSSTLS